METDRQLVREHAVRFFPRLRSRARASAAQSFRWRKVFRELKMIQRIDGAPFEVLRIPWLSIRIDAKKLAKGRLEMREVVVSQPTLRLRRRPDGTVEP